MDGVWDSGWETRIRARLVEHGYRDFRSFLIANPEATYSDLANALGDNDDVAPVQIEAMHVASTEGSEKLRREAIADSLFRRVLEALSAGWAKGIRWDSRLAGALANWCGMWEQEPWVSSVIKELHALSPPTGWKPKGPDDRTLQEALIRAKGESRGNSASFFDETTDQS